LLVANQRLFGSPQAAVRLNGNFTDGPGVHEDAEGFFGNALHAFPQEGAYLG
jgi:hypothetical protein